MNRRGAATEPNRKEGRVAGMFGTLALVITIIYWGFMVAVVLATTGNMFWYSALILMTFKAQLAYSLVALIVL